MQKRKDNIIVFQSEKPFKPQNHSPEFRSLWKNFRGEFEKSGIEVLLKRIIFKNCALVDIESGKENIVDILVEGDFVKEIKPCGSFEDIENKCDVVDVEGNYVLPPFSNCFCDSKRAIAENFGLTTEDELAEDVIGMKNVLSGALYVVDLSSKLMEKEKYVLEKVDEMEEKDLEMAQNEIASKNLTQYLKIGQNLMELGTVDKKYGKSLIEVLEDFGFFDRPATIVGGNCLEKDDFMLLQNYACDFVVCPNEDARQARRPTNLVTLKNMGFNVGIGSGYSFEIDFFAFMRQILLTHWSMFEDKSVLTEKDVFQMAIGGNVSFDESMPVDNRKIREGKMANFIVVRKNFVPYDNIFQKLVWGESKTDVLMTVCMGSILQQNGEILNSVSGLDYNGYLQILYFISRGEKNDN